MACSDSPAFHAKSRRFRHPIGTRRLGAVSRTDVSSQPARAFEAGVMKRTVVIEVASVEQAVAAYESPGYQRALRVVEQSATFASLMALHEAHLAGFRTERAR
jgi:uncharacterized protein (DUF1330 family)